MSKEELISYLKSFVISKDVFSANINSNDANILKKYYDSAYNKASRLVTEDEYVGRTFDNLAEINSVLIKSKSLSM